MYAGTAYPANRRRSPWLAHRNISLDDHGVELLEALCQPGGYQHEEQVHEIPSEGGHFGHDEDKQAREDVVLDVVEDEGVRGVAVLIQELEEQALRIVDSCKTNHTAVRGDTS